MIRSRAASGLWFILLAGTAAHLAFSWIGFNPTDEGFILSASRRLLDGQIPHRDFISIRPAGPYLTFLPVVWLGGDAVIWLSRWVAWLQFAATAWWWVTALLNLLRPAITGRARAALAGIALAFSAHSFPVMAWHSLDAMMWSALGLALVTTRRPGPRLAGYAALGAACLSRQNFALLIPGVLWLLDDWRRPWCWLAAAFPVAAAGTILWLLGAGPDAVAQLGSQRAILGVGLTPYLVSRELPWGLLAGYSGVLLLTGHVRLPGPARRGAVAGSGLLLGAAGWGALALATGAFALTHAFVLFGAVLGGLLCLVAGRAPRPRAVLGGAVVTAGAAALLWGVTHLIALVSLAGMLALGWLIGSEWLQDTGRSPVPPRDRTAAAVAGVLAQFAAWCVSVSFGYNTPALLSGPLVALLVLWPLVLAPAGVGGRRGPGWWPAATGAIAVLTMLSFAVTRCRNVYLDRPAWELTRPLGGVFPGGKLIRTNPDTAAFLEDLRAAVASVAPAPVAIVPDCASWWIRSPAPNPLPIDWPEGFTLGPPFLFARVAAALTTGPVRPVIIVQKVSAEWLSRGFLPLPDDSFHMMAPWVRHHFHKTGETRFFEMYH